MRRKTPTDREILDAIHDRYYETFLSQRDPSGRLTTPFVPIDIGQIADGLSVDPDLVFGRLYYHLRPRHRQLESNQETYSTLFELEVDSRPYCVNFPLLDSLVASMRDENRRWLLTTVIAVAGLVLSLVALIAGIL